MPFVLTPHSSLLSCCIAPGALSLNPSEWFAPPHAKPLKDYIAGFIPGYTTTMYIYPIVDLWASVQADFYFGKVYSTFDESACFMRGPDKVRARNAKVLLLLDLQ
jgi:hypothetical protein